MRIIAGNLKNKAIEAPKGLRVRPTSERMREMLFNMCQHEVIGAVFLDLFAGTGAMGIEAISRGAKKSVFIDNHPTSIQVIKKNLKNSGIIDKANVISGDVLSLLQGVKQKFQIIFADPPYTQNINIIIKEIGKCPHLFIEETRLFIENPKGVELLKESGILVLKREKKVGRSLLAEYCLQK
jgi:16S rRNA (guanine966-N2)-methyltransferase